MKRKFVMRLIIYAAGMLILALGITLNTKTGLGVSPIISVAYCISTIWELNQGNTIFVLYCVFIAIQIALHLGLSRRGGYSTDRKRRRILFDVLQIPVSAIVTRFMNLFSAWIPELAAGYPDSFPGSFAGRVFFLLVAVILTGVGAAMSLNMRIIPNPGDGVVQAISDTVGRSVGFIKNCVDFCCILVTIVVGLTAASRLIGVGLGTVIAVIGVGRVIAVFNHLTMKALLEAGGLEG